VEAFVFIGLLFAHWVGDFVCQTRYMADNKSKDWLALTSHVLTYMTVLGVFIGVLLVGLALNGPGYAGLFFLWLGVNFALHFGTDAITSRITSYYWSQRQTSAFFRTIGFDQFLHATALLLTTKYILGI